MECQSCPLQPVIDAFVKSDNLACLTAKNKHRKLRTAAQAVQSALSAVCLACSHTTDDDNPSNHGRSFVSLDNDSNADPDSGSSSRHGTNSVSDFLISRRRPDVHELDPHGCTTLPPDVEETLKRQFANFAELSPIDLCLIAHLMGGGSFATFASMSWLPHLPYDPQTLQPIPVSRQAIHARFRNIVRKMPVLSVIAQNISASSTQDNQHTKARRFSNVSAIGRSNSRLNRTRTNPVLTPSANKRRSVRQSFPIDPEDRPLVTKPHVSRPTSSRTRKKRPSPPASDLIQLTLF